MKKLLRRAYLCMGRESFVGLLETTTCLAFCTFVILLACLVLGYSNKRDAEKIQVYEVNTVNLVCETSKDNPRFKKPVFKEVVCYIVAKES